VVPLLRAEGGEKESEFGLTRTTPRKGFSVVVWFGALSMEGEKLGKWKAIIGFQPLLQAL